MEHPSEAEHRGGFEPGGGPAWEQFHDRLDELLETLDEGERLEVARPGAPWRIRISTGWPGVDGPGTLAYHFQIGSDRDGSLGPWADTPYCRSHGYRATKVAGQISATGLDAAPGGAGNPSMIASGSIAHLEVADLAVELLREVLSPTGPDGLVVDRGGAATDSVRQLPGPHESTGSAPQWWAAVGFDTTPELGPDGESALGFIDDILVEVSTDCESLPGLALVVARARLTDPEAVPLTLPSGGAASLLRWMRAAGGDGISVETVRSGAGTVHGWASRMVCGDSNPNALGRIDSLDRCGGTEAAAAEAAAEVVEFVRSTRRSQPEVMRPTRLLASIED